MTEPTTKKRAVYKTLDERLDAFMTDWVSNPAAQLDFAELIAECLDSEPGDPERLALAAWVQEQRHTAEYLGIRKRKR